MASLKKVYIIMLEQIQKELEKHIDFSYKRKTHINAVRYEDYLGVRTSINRKISEKYFQQVQFSNKKEIFKYCEQFLETGIHELKTIAFDWAYRICGQWGPADFYILEKWLYQYVNNYALCDDLCKHALHTSIYKYSQFLDKLNDWIKEKNSFWVRRAAPVTLLHLINKLDVLNFSLDMSIKLFSDEERMVQMGLGWLLKDLSVKYPEEVFDFLNQHNDLISRTALRTGVEKMPIDKKKKILFK